MFHSIVNLTLSAVVSALLTMKIACADVTSEWSPDQLEIIALASDWPFGIQEDFDAWVDGYHPQWTYWEVGTDSLRSLDEQIERVRNYVNTGAQVIAFDIDIKFVDIQKSMAVIRYNAVETIRESAERTIEVKFSATGIYARVGNDWKLYSTNILYAE